jgi:hypothetical protein
MTLKMPWEDGFSPVRFLTAVMDEHDYQQKRAEILDEDDPDLLQDDLDSVQQYRPAIHERLMADAEVKAHVDNVIKDA